MKRSNWEDDQEQVKGSITKKQLAVMYNVSGSTLSKWLNEDLLESLELAGYKKEASILTPRQLEIIYEHLGKP